MKARAQRIAAQILGKVERKCRAARRHLAQQSTTASALDRPNDADAWAKLYAAPVEPVKALSSEVARALEQLSRPGDVLLETGCGSATISAELAVVGRRIELADFSDAILARAQRLFAASALAAPVTKLADLTRPLPWADRSVDITWSSGVLEHWTDEELHPIVSEMRRVSRRRVVSFVPYAGSVFYRWGKWFAEQAGTWPYGRELPRQSLRQVFECAGFSRITEHTIWADASLIPLNSIDPDLASEARRWWSTLSADDPLRRTQGYLLLTVGEIEGTA